jgi:hypothetical protein
MASDSHYEPRLFPPNAALEEFEMAAGIAPESKSSAGNGSIGKPRATSPFRFPPSLSSGRAVPCGVMIVHHHRKTARSQVEYEGAEDMSGSGALFGEADSIVSIYKKVRRSDDTRRYKMVFDIRHTGATLTKFAAYVANIQPTAPVANALELNVTLRITGPVTWS